MNLCYKKPFCFTLQQAAGNLQVQNNSHLREPYILWVSLITERSFKISKCYISITEFCLYGFENFLAVIRWEDIHWIGSGSEKWPH